MKEAKEKGDMDISHGEDGRGYRKASTSSKAQGAAGIWQCQEGLIPRVSEGRGPLIIPTQTAGLRTMSKNISVVLKWPGLQGL